MTNTLEKIIQAAKDAGNPIKNNDTIAIGMYDDLTYGILYYDGHMSTGARIDKADIDEHDCEIDHIKLWHTWEANI